MRIKTKFRGIIDGKGEDLRINGAMKKNPKKNEKLEKKEMTKGSSPLNKNKDSKKERVTMEDSKGRTHEGSPLKREKKKVLKIFSRRVEKRGKNSPP